MHKSGISPLPPRPPQGPVHRLPPILRMHSPDPMPSCSKAPRGLFVLSRVTRIFTGTSISPGPLSRQRPSRYAFRAGRNLPDKEFRYLRTVIVTAAVYRGFGSELVQPLPLTFRHWAGVSPYTSACAFAETCVFGKQSLGPFTATPPSSPARGRLTSTGHPFSRSYGVNLPSSLTRGSPVHLGVFSTHLPVSVCGTGTTRILARGFSWQCGLNDSSLALRAPRPRASPSAARGDFPARASATRGHAPCPIGALASTLLRPPIALTRRRYRNINRLSIAYALRPRLRPD